MYYVFERNMKIVVIGTVGDPRGKAPIKISIEKSPKTYPDYFELQGVPIASDKLVKALKSAGAKINAKPAMLATKKEKIPGYQIFDVKEVPAMDLKESKYSDYKGMVARISKLMLKKVPANLKMFRLKEKKAVIIVSDDVAKTLKGFSGVVLSPANGWSDKKRY